MLHDICYILHLKYSSMHQNNLGIALIKSIVIIFTLVAILLTLGLAFRSARIQARDARRVADVKQIMDALKIYYDYNQKYPSVIEGQPKDITRYLEYWPQAPTPADGNCNELVNQYKYEQLANGESYKLSFCLGKGADGYAAGFYEVKP